MTPQQTVAVIGASNDRNKFGNKAVRAYQHQNYKVFPVNLFADTIEGIPAFKSIADIPEETTIDIVLVYLPPAKTLQVLPEIAEKGTGSLFLNPGSEDDAVISLARTLGLDPILACSIIAIGEVPMSYPG